MECTGHMTGSQRTAVARQIRNRQRHSPNPTQPSRGKSARIQCSFDQLGRSNRHRGASLKLPSGEFRVRTNASVGRTLAHKRHSAGNLRGGLCGIAMQKLARIRPVNIETKIESIEKRTRYSTPVALKRSVGATASRRHHSLTTRTRVHRRHEEEPRGHFDSGFGTSNPYGALFERLSKRIEHHRAELSEFIKEEHAGMRQRNFAGPNADASAANHRHSADPVMRCAQRRAADESSGKPEAGGRVDSRRFERALVIQIGQ
jgi:hypothetical protein